MQKEVRIIPREIYPFKIVTSTAQYGKDIVFHIDEKKKEESIEYLLTVKNIQKEKGIYRDKIILQTNSEIKPTIKIYVYLKILEREQKSTN